LPRGKICSAAQRVAEDVHCMTTPEARARTNIDDLLAAAGWQVQDRIRINLSAGRGVAVREFALKTGFADYLLFVDRKAIGAVEAKAEGIPLSGVESQSEKYSTGLPDIPPAWRKPLPFLYESTGVETFFTNGLDPVPRSRPPHLLRSFPQRVIDRDL
jgi:type I restriction enzyme R subunit